MFVDPSTTLLAYYSDHYGEDAEDRRIAKEEELDRLESELAERRLHGSEEEIAELEHEIADLRVRGTEGAPPGDIVKDMVTTSGWGINGCLLCLALSVLLLVRPRLAR